MGAYVNPEKGTKEQWLEANGEEIDEVRAKAHGDFANTLLVVCVQNPAFSAAAIAFNIIEQNEFLSPMDMRRKRYFLVPKVLLLPVSNLEDYLK